MEKAMSIATTKLGPSDHGLPMTYEEFLAGDYQRGYKYELIDGRLYVSPEADLPENSLEMWVFGKLFLYQQWREDIINYVTNKARIFVPGRRRITCPEPDLTAYHSFPKQVPIKDRDWRKVSPLLVVEILAGDDPFKDLVRNAELYIQVPSIKEYWVFDARDDPDRPTLIVHRRKGRKWQIIEVRYGETYTTRLLPGFELKIDPRS
jgi:Uma2 family endonuclease